VTAGDGRVPEAVCRRLAPVPLVVPQREPCPFCRHFTTRDEPSVTPGVVAEEDLIAVVLAPAPGGGIEGHALVVTRRHVPTIFDLTPDEAVAVVHGLTRIATALRSAVDLDGVLIEQRNGVGAGQSVPHVHFHVIPRRAESPWPPESLVSASPDERAAVAEQLRRHWR
jgi:histidine triad (HIT) family protein